jgi:hypothetical protein
VPIGELKERYSDCNLSGFRGVTHRTRASPKSLERAVFSCDYNGWADVPEEEREGIDAFESAPVLPPKAVLLVPIPIRSSLAIQVIPERRAA